jgi:streptogramin lyase
MAHDRGNQRGRVIALGVAALVGVGCSSPGTESTTLGNATGLTGILTTPTGGSLDGDSDDADGSGGGTKLDVAGSDLGGNAGDCPGGGGMMGEDVEFSYIWIANSPQGTVSKIDTRTGVEVGRYATGPAGQTEPSRTSVNLYGDVAVSNRGAQGGGSGGVTKIAARIDDCVDANANGTIETSTGPADVRGWGLDECVLWNVPIPSGQYEHGPRPTAWEGSVTQAGCAAPNPRLWLGWYDYVGNRGVFHRMSGATGAIEDTVEVVPWNGLNYGPYGGAVNKDGDFWVIGWQLGPLVRIDGDTLAVERIAMPPPPADQQWSYGMSLDQYGNPWVASAGAAAMYDVAAGQWQFISTGNQSMRGVMVDDEDRAWFAVDASGAFGCGLGIVDVQTRTLLAPAVALPGCFVPVGVSIDVEGYVWVVDQGANQAFKVDPDTYQVLLTVSGLFAPYTYSDMTGAGLNLVVNPPAG